MKHFARAAAAFAALALLWSAAASGQTPPEKIVPAQPGKRTPLPLPAPQNGGIRLSLEQAIVLSIANNEDLNVAVNAAEASNYLLFSNYGIFDPLLTAGVLRSHSDTPSSTVLAGATVQKSDQTDYPVTLSQLLPTGGTVSFGWDANRSSTNSTFFVVNPAYSGSAVVRLNQPLLKGFGALPTKWNIYIAKNARDASYLDYVRTVQTGVNSVEQAYWDLVYSLQNLDVKHESLTIAQELNRITKIKIDVGSLAPIDITQTEVGVANAEEDIITAEGLIGIAQDNLKRQLNFDPTQWASTPIVPTDEVRAENVQINVREGVKGAVLNRPEVIKQAYFTDADRIRYDYWKNQTLPGVNFVGSYGGVGLAGQFFVPDPSDPTGQRLIPDGSSPASDAFSDALRFKNKNWSIGLNVTYPILNRAARGQRGAAQYTWESDKALLITTQQDVIVNVLAAARVIDTSARQIVAAQKGRELAEKNLDA